MKHPINNFSNSENKMTAGDSMQQTWRSPPKMDNRVKSVYLRMKSFTTAADILVRPLQKLYI